MWDSGLIKCFIRTKTNNTFTMSAFHVSELAGQTIPVVMRISLLTKASSQISQVLNSMHRGDGFLANFLGKSRLHLLTDWSGQPVLTNWKRSKIKYWLTAIVRNLCQLKIYRFINPYKTISQYTVLSKNL